MIVFKSDFLKLMDDKSFVRWAALEDCYLARFSAGGTVKNALIAFESKGSNGIPAPVQKFINKEGGYNVAVVEFNDGDFENLQAVVLLDGACAYLQIEGGKVVNKEKFDAPKVRELQAQSTPEVVESEVATEMAEDEVVVEEEIVEEEIVEEEEVIEEEERKSE